MSPKNKRRTDFRDNFKHNTLYWMVAWHPMIPCTVYSCFHLGHWSEIWVCCSPDSRSIFRHAPSLDRSWRGREKQTCVLLALKNCPRDRRKLCCWSFTRFLFHGRISVLETKAKLYGKDTKRDKKEKDITQLNQKDTSVHNSSPCMAYLLYCQGNIANLQSIKKPPFSVSWNKEFGSRTKGTILICELGCSTSKSVRWQMKVEIYMLSGRSVMPMPIHVMPPKKK